MGKRFKLSRLFKRAIVKPPRQENTPNLPPVPLFPGFLMEFCPSSGLPPITDPRVGYPEPMKNDAATIAAIGEAVGAPCADLDGLKELWAGQNPAADKVDGIRLGADTPDDTIQCEQGNWLDCTIAAIDEELAAGRKVLVLPNATLGLDKGLAKKYDLVTINRDGVEHGLRTLADREFPVIGVSYLWMMLCGIRLPPGDWTIIVVRPRPSELPRAVVWQLRGRSRPIPAKVISIQERLLDEKDSISEHLNLFT